MKKGIIFDLDGVIVDTAKYHYLAWRKLANRLGFEFSQKQNELFKGVSRKRCMDILLEMGNVTATQEQKEAWMIEKNDDYLAFIEEMDDSEILPDVPKMLHFLKDNTIPIALGSASKNAKPILEKVGLLSYFDAIVDGNNVTKAKPDPEVFLLAAEKLGVEATNCIVFEDAVAGIEAANAANMMSIGIGEKEVLSEATFIFKDFTEISINFMNDLIQLEKKD
ncbi:MAG: beta-phosphoglucomutase [Flavobacteriia bacterium]|nr:beta-phosphoglucomutase [Flavobacteriia bacterium]OIP46137.1 MAG: beta-phosphoglucomutase [Flavobacteriaceae bacterium CG2_30_31_66]PIV96942.1 MAG: beta-phosphoglucomutase [Flavobacteriaceae bacterium CG17_big_fil_post_rev_8_21_14_2_50_31_13]PIX14850.1 MAG: beta-phosphoglucomutase [Flavobacteriaceae bacterium CG_4_8_14_3_um_filter_31_8]PIY15248.1 MAG: beta-phosphoglucomutase [Flavobacteriaceae bacterium CG_4_10_14_3_um_filter_31_253]PIZ12000.1 MAG: beta-phosphoglucomutase [Flavobacteriaceae